MIEINFYILVALLIASNAYWATVCLKLTNRLMSRNYIEFTQANKKPSKPVVVKDDISDPVAEQNARDMNAMIGIV